MGAILAGAALAGIAGVPAAAGDCTSNTDYTAAGTYCFRVPAGVSKVRFDVSGAQGGRGGTHGGAGGLGGQVIEDVAVSPGQTYTITVGGFGATGSEAQGAGSGWANGGFNGGGRGGGSNGTRTSSGGGGGGASDVRAADGTKIIVAGGGGGGGGWGSNLTNSDSLNVGGAGGDNVANGQGEAGHSERRLMYDGSAGRGGGQGGSNEPASFGQGRDGECILAFTCALGTGAGIRMGGGGGGGGGGWYGGGHGGAGEGAWQIGDGGGAGGGSSHASATATYRRGVNAGNGRVRISYFTTMSLISSRNPSTFAVDFPTFTAQLQSAPNGGTVTFTADGKPMPMCANVAVNSGTAVCKPMSTIDLSVGTHEVRATYSGAAGSVADTAVLSQVVVGRVDLTLSIAELGNRTEDVATGQSQEITLVAKAATMGSPLGEQLGPITFYNGDHKLGTVVPTPTTFTFSKATLRVTANKLYKGNNKLRLEYAGTTTTAASTSAVFNHLMNPRTTELYDDDLTSLQYVGSGWQYYANRPNGDYFDDLHATYQAGDYVTYNNVDFGQTVSIYGERSPDQGSIAIYWNNELMATVDTSGPTWNEPRQLLWTGTPKVYDHARVLKVVNLTQGKWFTLDLITVSSKWG